MEKKKTITHKKQLAVGTQVQTNGRLVYTVSIGNGKLIRTMDTVGEQPDREIAKLAIMAYIGYLKTSITKIKQRFRLSMDKKDMDLIEEVAWKIRENRNSMSHLKLFRGLELVVELLKLNEKKCPNIDNIIILEASLPVLEKLLKTDRLNR